MSGVTRRRFLQSASATVASGAALLGSRRLLASPFGLPLGLQLYSVRELLAKDYAGTLKQVAAAGYQEVEAAGFFNQTPQQVKQAMQAAGLRCVSAHFSYKDLVRDLERTIAFNKELGGQYIICSVPGYKDPAPSAAQGKTSANQARPVTLEDFRWNAEQFNRIGARVKAAGLRFGYHNHIMEFHAQNGVVPYEELMRLTDPGLVTFEMDCGWVIVGGGNPVDLLRRYPTRISMLHVKDFKPMTGAAAGAQPTPCELGQGTIDYHPIFAAAKKAEIEHYFVEQEGYDMPVFESLKIDADYIKNLEA